MREIVIYTVAHAIILMADLYVPENERLVMQYIPSGTIEITDNFFVDETEISNLSYLKYVYWLKNIFGDQSRQYLSSLPKQNFPELEDKCLREVMEAYWDSREYRDYPVVGITRQQAVEYCKWRSDRVFELMLINNKVIDADHEQNAGSYFTIEKYFKGNYKKYKPDTRFTSYLHYKLPDRPEWETALSHYNRKAGMMKKGKQHHKECSTTDTLMPAALKSCREHSSFVNPLKPVYCDPKGYDTYYFEGNVSEWLAEDGQYTGSNWMRTGTHQAKAGNGNTAASYIGFRPVCEWRTPDGI